MSLIVFCAFCDDPARYLYKQLGLCSWHQLLLYLGVVYVSERRA